MQNISDKSSAIIKTSKNNEESKKILQEFIEKQSRIEFQGGCVGIFEVNAEPARAFEYAKEEVRRAIDLLRFSIKAIHPLSEDIRIGLKGDHPKTQRQGFIFSESSLRAYPKRWYSRLKFSRSKESERR